MSDQNPDGNPVGYDFFETNYPYLNVKKNALNNYLGNWKRAIAPLNPFAMQQIPNQKRIGTRITSTQVSA